jgi:hypothetical protein
MYSNLNDYVSCRSVAQQLVLILYDALPEVDRKVPSCIQLHMTPGHR